MTEEEKKRLDELLKDVDNIPDIPEGQEDVVSCFIIGVMPAVRTRSEGKVEIFFSKLKKQHSIGSII